MKLCPQCEFIYEDDQTVCDMDGRELVYDPVPSICGETIISNSPEIISNSPEIHDTVEIPATVPSKRPVSQAATSHFRRTAFAALAAIVLVGLLFVVFYARTRQPRSGNANQASSQTPLSPELFTQIVTATQQASDLVSAPAEPDVSSPDGSPAESVDPATTSSSSPSLVSEGPAGRGRLINPVSAGGSGNRQPVVVWLANGSSIKADEAWEKKEGIWYRQGGMVTFLKRDRVRAIQRLASPNQPSKSVATKADEQNRKADNAIAQNHTPENTNAQNQTRTGTEVNSAGQNRKPENTIAQNRPIAKPDLVAVKKDSKVTSLLKKTGRILKRPFQF